MKTKHTPGPWTNYNNPLHSQEGLSDSDGNRICVFRLSPKDGLFENAEANAKLIAVAPDILRCLQAALSDLEHLKQLAFNGMPCEFSIGMFKRMDDYEKTIKEATK